MLLFDRLKRVEWDFTQRHGLMQLWRVPLVYGGTEGSTTDWCASLRISLRRHGRPGVSHTEAKQIRRP